MDFCTSSCVFAIYVYKQTHLTNNSKSYKLSNEEQTSICILPLIALPGNTLIKLLITGSMIFLTINQYTCKSLSHNYALFQINN